MSLWVLDQSKKYADNAVETYENMQGYIYSLTLSNNSVDADNDIDIAIGRARNDDNDYTMVLASAITKRSDAAWAVGTGNGGMDTGTKPNSGTLHIWLIRRSDTGVVDALFSISATAPTMPANYDQKRRIGSVLTGATTAPIMSFYQNGDNFIRNVDATADVDTTTVETTLTLVTLVVPTGVIVTPAMMIVAYQTGTSDAVLYFAPADTDDEIMVFFNLGADGHRYGNFVVFVPTNTSAQIRYRQVPTRIGRLRIFTNGWIDTRGRLG